MGIGNLQEGLSDSTVPHNKEGKRMEVIKGPDKRQNRDKWHAATFAIFVLIIPVGIYFRLFNEDCEFLRILTSQKMEELDSRFFVDMFATMLLGHLVAEHLRRLCLFWEELYHLGNRYQKSKLLALMTSLSVDKRSTILFGVIAILCLSVVVSGSYGFHFLFLIPIYSITYLLLHACGIWKPREADLQRLGGSAGNFGYVFSWQFYFGYLKIILPDFLDRVKDFEQREGVCIIVHKLFILLPESCYMPPLLNTREVGTMEYVRDLKNVCIDRNGAKGRVYKNPVYKVDLDGADPFYCCVESAAIINSLDDMCEKEKLTGVTEKKKSEELRNFHCTLQKILDEDEDGLGRFVHLVYYDDVGADGNKVKLSEVLKHHVGLELQQAVI